MGLNAEDTEVVEDLGRILKNEKNMARQGGMKNVFWTGGFIRGKIQCYSPPTCSQVQAWAAHRMTAQYIRRGGAKVRNKSLFRKPGVQKDDGLES